MVACGYHSPAMAFELFLALCALIVGVLLFLVLFEPGLRYRIVTPLPHASVEGFLQLIGSVTDSPVRHAREVEVLTDGPAFYEAELAAIRAKIGMNAP